MIFITEAVCSECGQPVRVYDTEQGTGDLYLKVGPDGITEAKAMCKNATICAERR